MISLYGTLARAFEAKYNTPAKSINIRVSSAAEMIRALDANFKGFSIMLKHKGAYKVARGLTLTHGKAIHEKEIDMTFPEHDWHIMPVATGCGGKGGFMQVVFGAVLIGASFFTGGMTLAGLKVSSMLFGMGSSMALGGVAQTLAPGPNAGNYADREKPDERPSYLSNGPVNAVEPGLTLPVAYGEEWSGTITESSGMKVVEI